MDRLINRRQQGDLGEASAIEWLTRHGARVSIPFGFSPDYDLIAECEGRLLRVQVKTSTVLETTPDGHERWNVHIATNGGNQSWNKVTKRFDAAAVNLLFALVGDGRRWLIPAREIEGTTNVRLGGPKYSEFEIEAGRSIQNLVYDTESVTVESGLTPGERRSRRADPVCKIGALVLSEFDSHLPHFSPVSRPPAVGRTRVSTSHQVTVPKAPLERAGLKSGDLIRVEALDDGAIRMTRIDGPPPGRVRP